ncbi:hypothetical protein HPB47_024517, partial [Ixodes persulcatus]
MREAAAEEVVLARRRGESPDEEGFWRIPVVVDGGWSKRSYGHNYNANSGVAVIVDGIPARSCTSVSETSSVRYADSLHRGVVLPAPDDTAATRERGQKS